MHFDPRDPNYDAKREFERTIAGQVGEFLQAHKKRVIAEIPDNRKALDDSFWQDEEQILLEIIRESITGMGVTSAETSLSQLPTDEIDEDTALQAARDWAEEHSAQLVRDITGNTRRNVQAAVNEFISTPGMTMQDVEDKIASQFGPARASRIATTEVTESFAQGAKAAGDRLREAGINLVDIWNTNNDGLVCRICRPLNRVRESPAGGFAPGGGLGVPAPPAHPECRCWITHEIAE